MLWIALRASASSEKPQASPLHDAASDSPEQLALAWWALQFSPRVCVLQEAVLLEVHGSLRLFGGQRALLQRVRAEAAQQQARALAVAPTALASLALLRTLPVLEAVEEDAVTAEPVPQAIPAKACAPATLQRTLDALPIEVLSATHPHAPTLQRLGCRTLGQVRALPRGGVSRRFGAALLEALDRAYGLRPDVFEWMALPEQLSAPGWSSWAASRLPKACSSARAACSHSWAPGCWRGSAAWWPSPCTGSTTSCAGAMPATEV
jgi:protein ImuB